VRQRSIKPCGGRMPARVPPRWPSAWLRRCAGVQPSPRAASRGIWSRRKP